MRPSPGSRVGAAAPAHGAPMQTGPFHAAFRAAVRDRGLTLDRLRWHLNQQGVVIALSTLSDWQLGRRRPTRPGSLRAVAALETVLGLPAGSLLRLLVEPVPDGGGPPAARPRDGLDERSGALGELLDGLPGSRDRDVDVISSQEKVFVDATRRASTVWCRTLIRARQGGVDRSVLRYFGDPGCRIAEVEVRALENCRPGRIRRHPAGVLVAELLFDQTLRVGETWVFEHRLVDHTGQPCTEHAHGFRLPGQQYLLEVRFDPATRPVDCHAFAMPGLYDHRQRTAELTPNRHHAVHLVASEVSAGVLGIGWAWR